MNIPHDISGIVPCLVIRFILVIPTTNLFPEAKKNILTCPNTPKELNGAGVFTCMKNPM